MEIFDSPCFSAEVSLHILVIRSSIHPYLFNLSWGNYYSVYPPHYFSQECESYAWKFEVVSFLINPTKIGPSCLLGNILLFKCSDTQTVTCVF